MSKKKKKTFRELITVENLFNDKALKIEGTEALIHLGLCVDYGITWVHILIATGNPFYKSGSLFFFFFFFFFLPPLYFGLCVFPLPRFSFSTFFFFPLLLSNITLR